MGKISISDVFKKEIVQKLKDGTFGKPDCAKCVFSHPECELGIKDKEHCEMFRAPYGVTVRKMLELSEYGIEGVWDKVKDFISREKFEEYLDKDWATQSLWGGK